MLAPKDFFDLSSFIHSELLFQNAKYVWDALRPGRLKNYISNFLETKAGIRGQIMQGATIEDESLVYIGEGTIVEPGAYIKGPAIIGQNCEIRQGAYIREYVLTGDGCIIGHTTEVKHSIFLNRSKAPHFSYVGDSILGNDANLGAGTKLSNLPVTSDVKVEKHSRPHIKIKMPDGQVINTQLSKFGAIIGDNVETGCNVVTNPGCLLGKGTIVYPNASLRGYYPPKTIIKWKPNLEFSEREER